MLNYGVVDGAKYELCGFARIWPSSYFSPLTIFSKKQNEKETTSKIMEARGANWRTA